MSQGAAGSGRAGALNKESYVRSHAKVPSAGSTNREPGHMLPRGFVATSAACVALLFAIFAPVASAAPTATQGLGYLTSFGGGEFANSGQEGAAVSVDGSTGNIIVANEYTFSVMVFAPDTGTGGTLLTSFPAVLPAVTAVDSATGDVYVLESGGATSVTRFVSDGAPTPTYTQDPGFAPTELPGSNGVTGGLAVDPTTHDVLVSSSTGAVSRIDGTTGALISSFTVRPNSNRLAVAPDGSIYVLQQSYDQVGVAPGVQHLSSSGALLGELSVSGTPSDIAINPVTGVVVVSYTPSAGGGLRLKGFSPTGSATFETVSPELGGFGLAIDGTSGRLYNFDGFDVNTFIPATYPGAEMPVLSALTTTSAHVSAEADPGAGPPAESLARFEYSADNGATWTSTPNQPLSGPATVEADLTGLSPNVDYLVRFVASNSLTSHTTDAKAFTTVGIPAETETGSATDVAETSAVLNGSINPVGLQTTYHFEYGTSTAYGSRAPVGIDAVAGNGRANRIFSRTIVGLAPGTTYHYRLVTQNSAGVNQGVDRTFTTAPAGSNVVRAYEQVTPVDKRGAALDARIGFQASPDGSGFSYLTRAGENGSPLFARSLSLRGELDWNGGISLDPPLNSGRALIAATTLAVSSDSAHAFVATNRDLTGGGIELGLNLYVFDVATGSYSLVGSSNAGGALMSFVTLQSGNKFIGGASDFSWVEFISPSPLIPGAPANALYRWSASGGLEVQSELPGGPASVTLNSFFVRSRSVSDDGSRSYFTVQAEPEAGVYLRAGGQTKAISVSQVPGDPTTPQPAQLMGVSRDGRYAFLFSFLTPLTADAPGEPGDLYRYDAADGSLEYLGAQVSPAFDGVGQPEAPLDVSDDGRAVYFGSAARTTEVWRDGVVKTVYPSPVGPGFRKSMSPNGRYFFFGIPGPQEPVDGRTGPAYVYDADTDQLSCVSCLSDGTPVEGRPPEGEKFASNRTPQAVTDAGQVFFSTLERLVATDVNGKSDVYVYQDGKASLISPGNAPFDAAFADISEDGSNVFFSTEQKLVGQDNDQSSDFYDARINGGLAKQNPPPPQECLRDDCKATPNGGPELPFGGSEALSGTENVRGEARKRCGKGRHARKVKGKQRCVKQSKAKKHAKKANTNRRQGR
jgi:hypothetical protein